MRLLLFVALSLSFAAGQSARVEGKLVSVTGEAVSRAEVRLALASVASDGDGKFVFEDVPPGRYTLAIEKAGFKAQEGGVALNLKAGMELKDLVVKLTPQGVITGKISDQDGDSVAGADVSVWRYDYVRGHRQLVFTMSDQTNDQGDYRITDLMPGRYYVRAAEPPEVSIRSLYGDLPGRAAREGMEGNIATYYPAALDASSASGLDVTPGVELRGIDIRLRWVKVYSVKGKMVNTSDGRPAAGCLLMLAPKDGDPYFGLTRVQPDGTFEFRGLRPETFELMANQLCGGFTAQQELTITTANIEGVEASLTANRPIPGTVTVEGGDLPRVGVGLVGPAGGAYRQVKNDGTFELPPAVGAGVFWWSVDGLPEENYVKSVHFVGRDVTRAPLDNTSGAGGALQIVLSSKAASLSGTAPKGTTVRIWPKIPDLGSHDGGVKSTPTDQEGGFKFASLAPGEYYVAAWNELESGLADSPEFLAKFNDDALLVKLEESGRATVEVRVIPPERVAAEIARLP